MKEAWWVILVAGMAACNRTQAPVVEQHPTAVATPPAATPAGAVTQVRMHNVRLQMDPTFAMDVRHLEGRLLRKNPAAIASFDDKSSFMLEIDSGEIAVDAANLTGLLNRQVFATAGSPVTDVTVSMAGKQMKMKGTLHKGLAVPFEMTSDVSASPDGKILIRPEKLRAEHLPVKGLMHLFGIKVGDLIGSRKVRGIVAEGDTMTLDPELILPPPRTRGRVTGVEIEGDRMVQFFGNAQRRAVNEKRNYMAFRGGTLQFGKLTMHDTDLQLIDADPRDPFLFYLDRYQEQLTAGYCKLTKTSGLEMYMPDYRKSIQSINIGKP